MNMMPHYDHYGVDHYDTDPYGLIHLARRAALQQVRAHLTTTGTVLDVACGTGGWLQALASLAPAECIGVDISAAMLAAARAKVNMRPIHADARELRQFVPPASVDLAASHFVFGFVEPASLIHPISEILKPRGYYSVVTSTWRAFPTFQRLGRLFVSPRRLRAAIPVPATTEELHGRLQAAGFEILASETVKQTFTIRSRQELHAFAIGTGWAAPCAKLLPHTRLISWLMMGFLPIRDHFEACIVLARKQKGT